MSGERTPPVTWLLLSDKGGDNAQAELLADAIGWPVTRKRVYPKAEWVLGKPQYTASLDHLDLTRSDPIEPPWPDLILTIGRRPSMAALWIRHQSGNRTRIVLIGRPKRHLDDFALVIAAAQYRLPARDNVLSIDWPLFRLDRAAIEEAGRSWRERLADLPRPITALFIGGPTKPYGMDTEVIRDLVRRTRSTTPNQGTLYATTSRRTPPPVVEALARELPPSAHLHRWSPDTAADNPYRALLALADRFVVTGDSISMMMEVAQLGKPLAIFPLPITRGLAGGLDRLARRLPEPLLAPLRARGLAGFERDLGTLHRALVQHGHAVFLGNPWQVPPHPLEAEIGVAARRVRSLFGLSGFFTDAP